MKIVLIAGLVAALAFAFLRSHNSLEGGSVSQTASPAEGNLGQSGMPDALSDQVTTSGRMVIPTDPVIANPSRSDSRALQLRFIWGDSEVYGELLEVNGSGEQSLFTGLPTELPDVDRLNDPGVEISLNNFKAVYAGHDALSDASEGAFLANSLTLPEGIRVTAYDRDSGEKVDSFSATLTLTDSFGGAITIRGSTIVLPQIPKAANVLFRAEGYSASKLRVSGSQGSQRVELDRSYPLTVTAEFQSRSAQAVIYGLDSGEVLSKIPFLESGESKVVELGRGAVVAELYTGSALELASGRELVTIGSNRRNEVHLSQRELSSSVTMRLIPRAGEQLEPFDVYVTPQGGGRSTRRTVGEKVLKGNRVGFIKEVAPLPYGSFVLYVEPYGLKQRFSTLPAEPHAYVEIDLGSTQLVRVWPVTLGTGDIPEGFSGMILPETAGASPISLAAPSQPGQPYTATVTSNIGYTLFGFADGHRTVEEKVIAQGFAQEDISLEMQPVDASILTVRLFADGSPVVIPESLLGPAGFTFFDATGKPIIQMGSEQDHVPGGFSSMSFELDFEGKLEVRTPPFSQFLAAAQVVFAERGKDEQLTIALRYK